MASISEEFPEMNDFIAAEYSHPMTLDLIRANDVEKIKRVFGEYNEGWDSYWNYHDCPVVWGYTEE